MSWIFDPLTPMKYGAILADPPWDHVMRSGKGTAKSPRAHYDTMSIDEIKALPVRDLAGPGCYLFLWTTGPHLQISLEVMAEWGFTYSTCGAWLKRTKNWKPGFGTGYVQRGACEFYLIGRLESVEIMSKSERNVIIAPQSVPDLIDAFRREHSRKPDQMRAMIDRLFPRQWFCELFAREPWPGHEVWGNEIKKFAVVGNG